MKNPFHPDEEICVWCLTKTPNYVYNDDLQNLPMCSDKDDCDKRWQFLSKELELQDKDEEE